MSSPDVTLWASDILLLLNLIEECIEDLGEDEQEALGRCLSQLHRQAPATVKDWADRVEAIGTFYQVAAEGGLLDLHSSDGDGHEEA